MAWRARDELLRHVDQALCELALLHHLPVYLLPDPAHHHHGLLLQPAALRRQAGRLVCSWGTIRMSLCLWGQFVCHYACGDNSYVTMLVGTIRMSLCLWGQFVCHYACGDNSYVTMLVGTICMSLCLWGHRSFHGVTFVCLSFTHQRRSAAMQGTNQLVRSNRGLGVSLRDTSTRCLR